MKIGLVTFTTSDSYRDKVGRGIKHRELYARKHGYDLCDDTTGAYAQDRKPSWSKLLVLNKYAQQGKYDWLAWQDADTLITNSTIRLEDLIVGSGVRDSHNLLLTRDPRGSINAGVFFVRCVPWSIEFLKAAYNNPIPKTHLTDQAAIIDLYKKNWSGAQDKIHIENRTWKFNSYPIEKNLIEDKGVPEVGIYHQGDFLVHFVGMSDTRLHPEYLKTSMDSFRPELYSVRDDNRFNEEYRVQWDMIYGKGRLLTYISQSVDGPLTANL